MTIASSTARVAAMTAALSLSALAPSVANACACGCGIFDVGDGTMLPGDAPSGFTAWFRYASMNQNRNWERGAPAPAADNGDQRTGRVG